jgi:hypothetical protein
MSTARFTLRAWSSVVGLLLTGAACGAGAQPLVLEGTGPYYRLTLPAAVYHYTAHPDLRDLRIRNAAGDAVPYSWLQAEGPAPLAQTTTVPVFAASKPPASVPQSAPREWLLDMGRIQGRLLQAHITLAPGTQGMFAVELEASDDLNHWRSLGPSQQLVVLDRAGQHVERLQLDLQGQQARYVRLRWSNPEHTATVSAVSVDSVQDSWPPAPLDWSAPVLAHSCTVDACDYILPRGLPAHSLRLQLQQTNTLAPLRISAVLDAAAPAPARHGLVHNPLFSLHALRHKHRTPVASTHAQEVPLLDAVAYRLSLQGTEVTSPDLPLDGAAYPRLRVRTTGPISALGAAPPTLQLATPQRALVFLAQGKAPFTLQWAEQAAAGAALPLATVLPGKQLAGQGPAAAQVLPNMGLAALTLSPPEVNPSPATVASAAQTQPVIDHKVWLWAGLLLGLGLLAGMAWSLLKGGKVD